MTLSIPEQFIIFKKRSFLKQGSFPSTKQHDPRPTFWEGTKTCTLYSPIGAPKCGRIPATIHQSFRIRDYMKSKIGRVISCTQKITKLMLRMHICRIIPLSRTLETFLQFLFCGFMKVDQYTINLIKNQLLLHTAKRIHN